MEPGGRSRVRVLVAASLAVSVALAASWAVPPAGAQEPPAATTTTATSTPPSTEPPSGPDGGVPTSVDPAAPGAPVSPDPAADPSATTTSTVPVDPLGASGEGLSEGSYGGQGAFDPGSRAVLGAELRAARRTLAAAEERYRSADAAIGDTTNELRSLAGRIEEISAEREDRVADASAAKASLQRRAVAAYVRGEDATNVIVAFGDPVDRSRALRYMEALADQDREAYDDYRRRIAGMNASERQLVDDQAAVQTRVAGLEQERRTALAAVLDAQRCVAAFAGGSHVCPAGFRFPVLGEVTFADTWGAPRMTGTAVQHWHEGTDIMAPEGREIVATEDGVISKVGSAGLGGLRLWLTGTSGTAYYYAHFSRFADGIVDGTTVTAGTVVGYVGTTGNAAGGAAHLHFEVHPGAGRPVNPAPLLFAAWGRRAMAPQSAIMERIPSVVGTLPPEEL